MDENVECTDNSEIESHLKECVCDETCKTCLAGSITQCETCDEE